MTRTPRTQLTLDVAQTRYNEHPTPYNVRKLINTILEYWIDGMISDQTFLHELRKIFGN